MSFKSGYFSRNNVVIIIHYDFSSNDIVIIVYYDFHGSRRCCCYRVLKCADNALLDYKHDFFCIERKNKTIEQTSFVSFFGQMVFQTKSIKMYLIITKNEVKLTNASCICKYRLLEMLKESFQSQEIIQKYLLLVFSRSMM